VEDPRTWTGSNLSMCILHTYIVTFILLPFASFNILSKREHMKYLQLFLLLLPLAGNAQNAATHHNPNAPLGSFGNHTMFDSVAVHFGFNSDWVNAKSVDGIVEIMSLTNLRSNSVVLKAYTDTVGDKASNLKLAEMRLNAVEKLLTSDVVVVERQIIGEDLSELADKDKRRVDVIAQFEKVPEPIVKETPKVELGVPIPLKIVFEGGTANILEESYPEIDRLLEIMKSDTTLKVQLNGHVCCDNDKELSIQRARAVKSVLMNNGIAETRMTTEGFGNTKPLFEDDTEEHRHRNRRVEAVFSR